MIPKPAIAFQNWVRTVETAMKSAAKMKTSGVTGYPQVLYGRGISGFFRLRMITAATVKPKKIHCPKMTYVKSRSNVPKNRMRTMLQTPMAMIEIWGVRNFGWMEASSLKKIPSLAMA